LRLDTETAARIRHASALGRGAGAVAPSAARTVASQWVRLVPVLRTLLETDEAVAELGERLEDCARQAERQVNFMHFGDRAPTRAECVEELEVDGCGARVTRAMQLGQQKHVRALLCAREVLQEHWPGAFSIEQRYLYHRHAGVLETVSPQEEARLIKQGCTAELWRTIKPDLVLHPGRDLLRAVLILDYKFPCPATNEPRWKKYEEPSAYAGLEQGRLYQEALGGVPLLISPGTGLTP
jgi:hypothetical protein